MTFWPQNKYNLKATFAAAAICASTVYLAWQAGPIVTAAASALALFCIRKDLPAVVPFLPEKMKER